MLSKLYCHKLWNKTYTIVCEKCRTCKPNMVEKSKTHRNQQIFKLSQWLARFNWVDHVYNDEEKFFKNVYYIREISQMVLLYL